MLSVFLSLCYVPIALKRSQSLLLIICLHMSSIVRFSDFISLLFIALLVLTFF